MAEAEKEPTDLLELFARVLDEIGFEYERDPRGYLKTGISMENGKYKIIIDAGGSGTRAVWVLAMAPLTIPTRRVDAALKWVADLNWHLKVGSFEIDRSDGEVRVRTSLFVGSAEPEVEILQHLLFANCMIMDKHLPGLLRICAGDPPEVALRSVEIDGEIQAPTSVAVH